MPTEDWNCLVTVTPTPTLNLDQDILEPSGPAWKPASTDAPAMPHYTVKFVVKPALAQPPHSGLGRG